MKKGLYYMSKIKIIKNWIDRARSNLEISKPEVAIQAMSALRGMNTVNLDIIRNSSKLTMSYQIR